MSTDTQKPRPHRTKYYTPLESNPEVFTSLISNLGLSSLAFTDVYSLTDLDLLAFITRPALALVLIFPISEQHDQWTAEAEKDRPVYEGKGEGEEVVWFKQTIGNACGLYGILHAVSNGGARDFMKPNTPISNLLATVTPLSPKSRAVALEESKEVEAAHAKAGQQGDTAAPEQPDVDVDYHYIAFVPSHQVGSDGTRKVFEMDGTKKGPVFTNVRLSDGEDALDAKVLGLVQAHIQREEEASKKEGKDGNIGFSLMALVPSEQG
ncbi:hypothetical protein BDV98DRAFT_573708 [Pterulicium gracile]|uniref:Ubiquitin carboxyl-terminal hydrolase n=1 Tax=Pterulicium gracile TaxID=1884261 RepID=A0A5C3QAA9_9AGAR|nr:hypothetical protein BDV98DRAFT_573708 [Pterula gracilis]